MKLLDVQPILPASPLSTCPCCLGNFSRVLDEISIEQQHLLLAQRNGELAVRLDHSFGNPIKNYHMLVCEGCQLEFAQPMYAPPSKWYAELYSSTDLYPGKRWEYEIVYESLHRADVVVDYGCGSGHFLKSIIPKGALGIGYDFSSVSVHQAREEGLTVNLLSLDDNSHTQEYKLSDPADHVTAFHIIEHLVDPSVIFTFASGVIKKNGRLWIAIPSDQRASRLYGEFDKLDNPPHHLTRWTEKALIALATRCGWEMVEFCREPLPQKLGIWETTRRLKMYHKISPKSRWLSQLYRRVLALGVLSLGLHRRKALSGFSMLACFRIKS